MRQAFSRQFSPARRPNQEFAPQQKRLHFVDKRIGRDVHRRGDRFDADRAAEGVLSDDRIVEILKEAGVDIARRTVAKYREAMRIPSSVERRRILREAS